MSSRACRDRVRTCRTIRPAWRAKSGSRSGPKTSRATTPITMNSAKPIPIMARLPDSELAGGCEAELHAGQVSSTSDQPDGDAVESTGRGGVRVGHHDGSTRVAALAEGDVERHLAEDLHRVAE